MTDQSGAGQAPAAEQVRASTAGAGAPNDPKDGAPRDAPRRSSSLALRNWRVSWRLIALIAIPTITAIAFGAVRIEDAANSATSYQRVEQLASLSNAITRLSYVMQDERDDLAGYIAEGRPGGSALNAVNTEFNVTDGAANQVTRLAGGVGSTYPAQVRAEVQTVLDRLSDLPRVRTDAIHTQVPALTIIQDYSAAISDFFTLDDEIALGSSDPTLATSVSALSAISRTEDEAAQERGILYAALIARQFEPGAAQALTGAQSQQAADLTEFESDLPAGQSEYTNTVVGTPVDQAATMEQQAIASGGNGGILTVASPAGFPSAAAAWNSDQTAAINDIRHVEQDVVNSVIGQSRALHSQATRTMLDTGIIVLAVLLFVLIITIVMARSMVLPLRKLRTGALEVAGLRLPETVRRMSETDGEGVPLDVEPIEVDSSDEIGEVARAFDQVHREALRLAANEAALRGNVNAMFMNLSRRSQSLVERQIRLIDDLEQGEQDPERLASLFQMDHLATRMRRNSENLLVLAGHDETRRWNQPVALVDVLRAALSEIEQYERVTLNVQPGIAVRGQAVSDVVHLTAELVENATSFSAADTPVTISGHLLSSGGVLLEITDQGVGMGAEEMAHANWRLDNPPVVDVAVSRRMGLFVVARLAARHGIRVRLRPAASGGLIALGWLPDEVIMHEAADGTPGPRRSDAGAAEPVIAPVADGAFGGNGTTTSGWGDSGRSVAEQEVDAARAPRFASLHADAEETTLGPKRIPGAGPRPGAGWATTGPLPAFRTVPRPASNGGSEPGATGPLPAVTGPQPAVTGPQPPVTGSQPAVPGSQAAVTGPQPAVTGPQPAVTGPVINTGPAGTGSDGPVTGSSAPSFDSFVKGLKAKDEDRAEEPADATAAPVLSAPAVAWDTATLGGVVVPPADGLGEEHRLPIFEAVESDWFRRGRQAVGRPGSGHDGEADSGAGTGNGNSWISAADEGWAAAEVVHAPTSGGVTPAGLPKRVPRANLVPGAATAAPSSVAPTRSAAATRERFASFQRGAKEGRAAAGGTGSDDGEDASSE